MKNMKERWKRAAAIGLAAILLTAQLPVAAFAEEAVMQETAAELVRQTKENWQIRLEGRLCNSGRKLKITPYEELKAFIQEQLGDLFEEDDPNG